MKRQGDTGSGQAQSGREEQGKKEMGERLGQRVEKGSKKDKGAGRKDNDGGRDSVRESETTWGELENSEQQASDTSGCRTHADHCAQGRRACYLTKALLVGRWGGGGSWEACFRRLPCHPAHPQLPGPWTKWGLEQVHTQPPGQTMWDLVGNGALSCL